MPPKGKVHKKGAGRPLSYSLEEEQTLVGWILEMRDLHLPVSIAEVKQKAKEVIGEENPSFKASSGWIQKFFKRNQFTLRAKTSLTVFAKGPGGKADILHLLHEAALGTKELSYGFHRKHG